MPVFFLVCLQQRTFTSPPLEETELEKKLARIQELQRQIDDQSFKISELREEKVS
jgi:hypothetical protein